MRAALAQWQSNCFVNSRSSVRSREAAQIDKLSKHTVKRNYRVERLARKEEKLIVKRIFTLSIFSVILIIVLFTLGIPVLGKFADFLDSAFKKDSTTTQETSIVNPPRFDTFAKKTNQERITIWGFAPSGGKVELYKDGEISDTVDVVDGRFEFKDFRLSRGENRLKVRSVEENKTSDFSDEENVLLDMVEPQLEVTSPVDDQTFEQNNRVKVTGKAEKDTQVFANGFLANVDTEGNFEVTVPISEGDSEIEVKAQDEAGNTKIVKVKVHFRK